MNLNDLTPVTHSNVIDIVRSVGISVDDWAINKDGETVTNPSANQSKIFNWSFGKENEPKLLFIWHSSLTKDDDENIVFIDSFKSYKDALGSIRGGNLKGSKISAKLRYDRAWSFGDCVRKLALSGSPCKVALLVAKDNQTTDELEPSSVKLRQLDSEDWYVHSYDVYTEEFKIVRGLPPPLFITIESQFDIYEPPVKYPTENEGYAYTRSIEVRNTVLKRSNGHCEYCNEKGFLTSNDTLYLEVHHVVPLFKNGADDIWNTVGVCPKHHREAHFGKSRLELLDYFVSYLSKKYPNSAVMLSKLAEQVEW